MTAEQLIKDLTLAKFYAEPARLTPEQIDFLIARLRWEGVEEKMIKLAQDGWEVLLTATSPTEWSVDAEQGQVQCPHEGRYNPENGHGFSYCSTETLAAKVFKDTGSVLTFTTPRAAFDALDTLIKEEMQRPVAAPGMTAGHPAALPVDE